MALAERALITGGIISLLVALYLWWSLPVVSLGEPSGTIHTSTIITTAAAAGFPGVGSGDGSHNNSQRHAYTFGLATHVSVDKLFFIPEIVARWHGPIGVAVYFPARACGKAPALLQKVRSSYGLPDIVKLAYLCGDSDGYPINKLRNLGIKQLATTHFIMLDVDLMPSEELLTALSNLPANFLADERAALVVPAFEWTHNDCESTQQCFDEFRPKLPRTLSQLRQCMDAKHCDVFYGYWARDTHADTNSSRWLAWSLGLEEGAQGGSEPYRIHCFQYPKYEPYVVLANLPSTPRYDERFMGYGKNKIQLITHLQHAGFSFYVVPRGFVVHMPHLESQHKERWLDASTGDKSAMDQLFDQFVLELANKYHFLARPGLAATPPCSIVPP